MKQNKKQKHFSFAKYIPVLIIMLSLSIIVSSTFAFFTNTIAPTNDATVNFGKVELTSDMAQQVTGSFMDAVPGDTIIDNAIEFSLTENSKPAYVRAKISYSTTDGSMLTYVNKLRKLETEDYEITNDVQNDYKWGEKDGNYIYLENKSNTDLYTVAYNSVDNPTYTLLDKFVLPKALKNSTDNDQYMKNINFHIAIQAIQADNIPAGQDVKELFNSLFPENENEKIKYVTLTFEDGLGNPYHNEDANYTLVGLDGTLQVMYGDTLGDLNIKAPTQSGYAFGGWSTDGTSANKVLTTAPILANTTLLPIFEQYNYLLHRVVAMPGVSTAYNVPFAFISTSSAPYYTYTDNENNTVTIPSNYVVLDENSHAYTATIPVEGTTYTDGENTVTIPSERIDNNVATINVMMNSDPGLYKVECDQLSFHISEVDYDASIYYNEYDENSGTYTGYYGSTGVVFEMGMSVQDSIRLITFYEEPSDQLKTWLNTNATRVDISVDQIMRDTQDYFLDAVPTSNIDNDSPEYIFVEDAMYGYVLYVKQNNSYVKATQTKAYKLNPSTLTLDSNIDGVYNITTNSTEGGLAAIDIEFSSSNDTIATRRNPLDSRYNIYSNGSTAREFLNDIVIFDLDLTNSTEYAKLNAWLSNSNNATEITIVEGASSVTTNEGQYILETNGWSYEIYLLQVDDSDPQNIVYSYIPLLTTNAYYLDGLTTSDFVTLYNNMGTDKTFEGYVYFSDTSSIWTTFEVTSDGRLLADDDGNEIIVFNNGFSGNAFTKFIQIRFNAEQTTKNSALNTLLANAHTAKVASGMMPTATSTSPEYVLYTSYGPSGAETHIYHLVENGGSYSYTQIA